MSSTWQEDPWVEVVFRTAREPLLLLDADLRVQRVNAALCELFEAGSGEVLHHRLDAAARGALKDTPLCERLAGLSEETPEIRDLEVDTANSVRRTLLVNARRFDHGGRPAILLSVQKVSLQRAYDLEIKRQRQWFATTLSSIGDAVIAADRDARVTFINPAAERLTGWREKDALGRPLQEVFNIVNEDTRQLVESPVSKALRLGVVVGLANHTVLVARDGTERPIDDSAAPIRDSNGDVQGVVLVFHDVTERREAERAQGRLAEIVASSDDAIVAKDLNGIITDWNRGAERLFGYTREEAIGRSILMIIPQERREEETLVLSTIRSGKRVDHFETVRRRKDGVLVDISLTVSPIRNRHGEIIGASKIARDITERKRAEAQVQRHLMNEQSLRMEAENANRAKDLFLATLSHELRTPLNAIVGWVGILRAPAVKAEELREGLEVIERNTRAQVRLIEDVLDISRIVSGKLKLNVKTCDLANVIDAAIDSIRPAADAREIAIEKHIDLTARSAHCDAGRMQQVVWNLLSNAIKFTPRRGTVAVTLDRARSRTRLTVSDTGQGISAEFLPYVFDRFRQEDASTRRKLGGLGLGLSIVKQLVELHGGTVHAQSGGEGQGATFVVELPVSAVAAPAEQAEPESGVMPLTQGASASVRLDGLRIVVVDDEPDARRLLSKVLSESGAAVTAAGSVPDALHAIDATNPQVLVSDIAMPEEDGYDLIRQLREKGVDARTLPAVALTAFAHKGYARSALLAGFQVHVAKPVDPRDLLAVVASLTGRTGPGA
jgi:PAS domain S-box-containing protein